MSWKASTPVEYEIARVSSLQWGHDEGVVEGDQMQPDRPALRACFNGATTKVSWKATARHDGDAGLVTRFNGATTKESWKADRGDRVASAIVSASMGPRRRCRGRRGMTAASARASASGFNGATTKVSWKAPISRLDARPTLRFNGATTKVSWKAPVARRSCRRADRFNGATTKESWKASS